MSVQQFTLTPGTDKFHATGTGKVVVSGTNLTLTTGDVIVGNGDHTTFNLHLGSNLNFNGGQPGVARVAKVGKVVINAHTINLGFPTQMDIDGSKWSKVGSVVIGNSSLVSNVITSQQHVTLDNVIHKTVYGLQSHSNAQLTVNYRGNPNVEHLSLNGAGDNLALPIGAPSLDFNWGKLNLAANTADTSASLTTHGVNMADVMFGGQMTSLTVANAHPKGATNFVDFSGLGHATSTANPTGAFTFDASGTTGANAFDLNFVGNDGVKTGDTIKGGSGADSVFTSLAGSPTATTSVALTMSGVEKLFLEDNSTGVNWDGTNVTGMQQITFDTDGGTVPVTVTNAGSDMTAVTLLSDNKGAVSVSYATVANDLAVTWAHSANDDANAASIETADAAFGGLTVANVKSVTANFQATAAAGTGNVVLDPVNTTALALVNGINATTTASNNTVTAVMNADVLTSLSLSAVGNTGHLDVQDVQFATVNATEPLATLSVTASGPNAWAMLDNVSAQQTFTTNGATDATADLATHPGAFSLTTLTDSASGANSIAQIGAGSKDIVTLGHMTSVTLEAAGATSTAKMWDLVVGHNGAAGGIDTVSITASGAASNAELSDNIDVYQANVGTVDVTASGAGSIAQLSPIGWLHVFNGAITTLDVTASGTNSTANAWVQAIGDANGKVGEIDVNATGGGTTGSTAYADAHADAGYTTVKMMATNPLDTAKVDLYSKVDGGAITATGGGHIVVNSFGVGDFATVDLSGTTGTNVGNSATTTGTAVVDSGSGGGHTITETVIMGAGTDTLNLDASGANTITNSIDFSHVDTTLVYAGLGAGASSAASAIINNAINVLDINGAGTAAAGSAMHFGVFNNAVAGTNLLAAAAGAFADIGAFATSAAGQMTGNVHYILEDTTVAGGIAGHLGDAYLAVGGNGVVHEVIDLVGASAATLLGIQGHILA